MHAVDTAAPTAGITSWVHPTGQSPRSVVILGLGPTSNEWHAANFHYVPGLPPVDEVWTVNKGARTVVCDLVFVMDDLVGEYRKAPAYLDDLVRSGRPIITSAIDAAVLELVPAFARSRFVEYPLQDVLEEVGGIVRAARLARAADSAAPRALEDEQSDLWLGTRNGYYFHNSIPYMLAYALAIGVESVLLFGCDYTFPGTDIREDDRANAEYWVGFLRAAGVRVTVSSSTTLLNARRQPWAYGFGARQPVIE